MKQFYIICYLTIIVLILPVQSQSAEHMNYTIEQWQEFFYGFHVYDIYREGNNAVWIAGRLTLRDKPTLTRYDETGFTTWFIGAHEKNFQFKSIMGPAHVRFIISEQTDEFFDYKLLDGQWTIDDGDESWSTETPPNNGIIEQAGFTIPLMLGNEWVYQRDFYYKTEFSQIEHHDRVIDTVGKVSNLF